MLRVAAGVLAALMMAGATGCGIDSEKAILMAVGAYGDLAVATNQDALLPLARQFTSSFATQLTFVIKPEYDYQVDVYGPNDWKNAKNYKNCLFIIETGAGGRLAKAMQKKMTASSWARLDSPAGGVVQLKDPWSTYQYAIVVAAQDRNTLSSLLMHSAGAIKELLADNNRKRILRRNRYDGLNQRLMDSLWQDYNFSIQIPQKFAQNQREPDGYPGLELMQNGPSRGISISWTACSDPVAALQDHGALLKLRTEMAIKLHSEDLVPTSLIWDAADAHDGPNGIRLRGAWASRRFAGGGPFWSYFVADPLGHRLFCIDLLVYAPGVDKMNFFRHMEAIASTFTVGQVHP